MTFKVFDKTLKRNHAPRSIILFLTLNDRGKVNFSQAARRWFSLEEGDRIVFHQDLEFRSHWFIQITKEIRGYKLVFGVNDTRLTAAYPVAEIFKSIGKKPQKLTFLISKQPKILNSTVYYQIELRNIIIEK